MFDFAGSRSGASVSPSNSLSRVSVTPLSKVSGTAGFENTTDLGGLTATPASDYTLEETTRNGTLTTVAPAESGNVSSPEAGIISTAPWMGSNTTGMDATATGNSSATTVNPLWLNTTENGTKIGNFSVSETGNISTVSWMDFNTTGNGSVITEPAGNGTEIGNFSVPEAGNASTISWMDFNTTGNGSVITEPAGNGTEIGSFSVPAAGNASTVSWMDFNTTELNSNATGGNGSVTTMNPLWDETTGNGTENGNASIPEVGIVSTTSWLDINSTGNGSVTVTGAEVGFMVSGNESTSAPGNGSSTPVNGTTTPGTDVNVTLAASNNGSVFESGSNTAADYTASGSTPMSDSTGGQSTSLMTSAGGDTVTPTPETGSGNVTETDSSIVSEAVASDSNNLSEWRTAVLDRHLCICLFNIEAYIRYRAKKET